MAKKMSEVHSTSVDRFNRELARKVATGEGRAEAEPKSLEQDATRELEKFDKQVRVLATESQAHECNLYLLELRKKTGVTTLNWSQVTRALWLLLLGEVSLHVPRESLMLRKPQTNDLEAMHQFDQELARYLYYLIVERTSSK